MLTLLIQALLCGLFLHAGVFYVAWKRLATNQDLTVWQGYRDYLRTDTRHALWTYLAFAFAMLVVLGLAQLIGSFFS
jgi:hypothetical protein